ncbi:hypothetical protein ACFQU7_08890 [Pseudoroseomonas wenyumeiae]
MQGDDASRRSAAPQRRLRPFRSLDALLVAAVLLPALLFGALATFDRSQALATAERDLLATLDTLYGHAEKVIEFQVLALGATDERLRGLSNEAVAANVVDHHAYLRALSLYVARIGIVVLGPDGQVLVDSVNEQPPPTSVPAIANTSAGTRSIPARNSMSPVCCTAAIMVAWCSLSRGGAPPPMAASWA